MVIVGIDLGTTNSLVSTYKDGEVVMIPNSFGSYLTPSIVSIDDEQNVYIGHAAKERLISHPQLTVSSFKRFMGTNKIIKLGDKQFTPEELSAFIIRDLVNDAEKFLNTKVDEVIISVPAYFNDDSRTATKNAAKIAGTYVDRVINEPSAASLAAGALDDMNNCTVLVVDLGGGTLDVSLVEYFGNIVSILAVSGDNHLGGDDFDFYIAKHFCKVNEINYARLSQVSKNILLKNAENCKIELSKNNEATITIKTEDIDASLTITTKDLIQICSELLSRIQEPIRKVLVDSGVNINEIDNVILVGGGCKINIVKNFIAHIMKKEPLELGESDQTVAKGVGVYTGIKSRNEDIKQLVLTDICPFSLGISVANNMSSDDNEGLFSPIIERNTPLPVSRTQTYLPTSVNQEYMKIDIYQGEGLYVRDNLLLGTMNIHLPLAKDQSVKITLAYDINGILQVGAQINHTGENISKIILSKSGEKLTEKELEKKLVELSNYKKHNEMEQQINFLMDTAKSLHEQLVGSVRDTLMENLYGFNRLVQNTNSMNKKHQAMKAFWEQLQSIKNHINYDPFENVDEKTWAWNDESDNDDDYFA